MKRFWKFAGIATLVAMLGVLAVGAVAFAQDAEDGSGWPFDFRGKFKEAVAEFLGIDVETYDAALEHAQDEVVDEALAEGWLTEEQAERMRERMDGGFGARGMAKGLVGPRGGFMGRGEDSIIGMVAEELDMSVEDLFAQLQDGKSFADLLSEDQIETITNNHLDQLEENLNQAVDDGKITDNQADWMLEKAKERVSDLFSKTWEGRVPGGFRGGGRPGRMGGFPGETDA
jgi:hypothetical protein